MKNIHNWGSLGYVENQDPFKSIKEFYKNVPMENLMNRNKLVPLESEEAKTLVEWSRYHTIAKDHLIHIANETKTSPQNGKHLRDMGKRKGVSDYFLAYPVRRIDGKGYYGGLWIELKRSCKKSSKLTQEQAEWLSKCERVGYATKVAYGASEAIKSIEEYLG